MMFHYKITILTLSLSLILGLTGCHDNNAKPPALALPNSLKTLSETYVEKQQFRSKQPVIQVQEVATQVSIAPSMIQLVTKDTNLQTNQASQWAFRLDEKLNLFDQQGHMHGSLVQFLADPERRTLAVLTVKNEKTLNALVELASEVDLTDLTLRSNDEELLRKIHVLLPFTRSALDLSHAKKMGSQREDLAAIIHQTNRSMARIVILPEHLIAKENVAFLQQRLLTVWGESSAASLPGAAKVLVSGLNAIITPHSTYYQQILQSMPSNTLLRKPLVIGHRGVPSLEDENTLQGAAKAVALGADIVENDVYITKDNHLVIMHDPKVDRTTNGHGYIEDMTLAEVKQLSTHRGYQVPTLGEYFQTFKNNKDMVHFVEIKGGNAKIVPQLKKEIAQYDIQDQVVAISFHVAQIKRMKNQLPEYTTGFLTGDVPKSNHVNQNIKTLMEMTQRHSSTFNSSYDNLTAALLEAGKHRGITVWPWTFRDENIFKKYYVMGLNGLTTDYSQFASNYVVDISTDPTACVAEVGELIQFPITISTQNKQRQQVYANQLILLSSQQASYRDQEGIRYVSPGTAYVMPGYKYHIDGRYAYSIFAEPIKLTINEKAVEEVQQAVSESVQ